VTRWITIEEVARFLDLEAGGSLLADLRGEGLFPEDRLSPEEADDLRVALTLMRELGVNAAGVEVALHLRRRLLCLEDRMREILRGREDNR
jgi:hypothetical protein